MASGGCRLLVRWLWVSAAVGVALLLAGAGVAQAASNSYCEVCQDHTMCRYQGMSDECKARSLSSGLQQGDAELILRLHNQMRSRVATGRELRGNQPPAADMRKLVWDRQLATIAQRWVDQCRYAHDDCRDLRSFQVGQNLFVVYGSESEAAANWSATIHSWYNEVEIFDTSNVDKFRSLDKSAHYSQLVAAVTRRLGCGHGAWRGDDDGGAQPVTSMYVCNYGPAGNRFGRPVYTVGQPCSRCPPAHRCSPEVGLCESLFRPLSQQQPQLCLS